MGHKRHKPSDAKGRTVRFRLSERDYRRLLDLAKADEVRSSELLRNLIREEQTRREMNKGV
jgi:hypothetical protein